MISTYEDFFDALTEYINTVHKGIEYDDKELCDFMAEHLPGNVRFSKAIMLYGMLEPESTPSIAYRTYILNPESDFWNEWYMARLQKACAHKPSDKEINARVMPMLDLFAYLSENGEYEDMSACVGYALKAFSELYAYRYREAIKDAARALVIDPKQTLCPIIIEMAQLGRHTSDIF